MQALTLECGGNIEHLATREDWRPQKRHGTVTACRIKAQWRGRWYRVYSDHAPLRRACPHFIRPRGVRVYVYGVAP